MERTPASGCEIMGMGRKVKKRNRRKKNRRGSFGRAFLVTFTVTLAAGGCALGIFLIWNQVRDGGTDPVISEIARIEEEDIPVRHEQKPENAEAAEDAEPEKAGEESAREDDGFDGDGCIRDENGRILEKKVETAGEEATLLFAGDILFDDGYAMMGSLRKRGDIRACFSAETLAEMAEADIFMLNNEFTYTSRGEPTPEKQFTFRAKPENAALLHELGVDIVSLANNHAYDYGEISLLDSLTTLEGIGMPYVGAGRNLEEASRTIYFYAGNQKIAYISGTMIERQDNPDTKGATESAPGVFRCFSEKKIFDRIAGAKETGSFVVVYIHWGTEKTEKPDWSQPDMAKKLVDAGADLIIGDHPHVLQPLTGINDTPVIYSVGNYWFNSSTLDTCLVKVKVKDGEMQSFQFLPARQSDCYTELLYGAEKDAVLNYMRGISPGVTIDAEGYVGF